MDYKKAIFEIASALGANEVDVPSFQYQNSCSGGVNGLIADEDVETVYEAATKAFDFLFPNSQEDPKFEYYGIPKIVWAVVDSHWEEILKEMESQDYLTPCENCSDLYYPEDMTKIDGLIYCENCKGNPIK